LGGEKGKSVSEEEAVAVAVGLDGWHHSRAELDAFPVCYTLTPALQRRADIPNAQDPIEARRRRGAAFTFDALSYVSFVRALRSNPVLPSVPFPLFSHAVKDPTPSPSPILPNHQIVIIEGLYTLLDIDPWSEATKELDVKIWVECERSIARERLIQRHLESGIEPDRQAAEQRGELILLCRSLRVTLIHDALARSRRVGYDEWRVYSRTFS